MMKKLILLFFVCWLAIMDAAAIYVPPIRTKDPMELRTIDSVWCLGVICIIFIIVGNKLEDDKLKDEKDEQEKLKQNRVRPSKKTKPINEKFKKYEIYTSKNFKKKK